MVHYTAIAGLALSSILLSAQDAATYILTMTPLLFYNVQVPFDNTLVAYLWTDERVMEIVDVVLNKNNSNGN